MKTNQKIAVSVVIILSIVTFVFIFSFRQEAQTNPNDKLKRFLNYKRIKNSPITLANNEDSPQKAEARKIKNQLYKNKFGENLMLQKEGETYSRESEAKSYKALPFDESEIVAIGKILKAQPYLAEGNTSIYSEFSVQTEVIFKNTFNNLRLGEILIADREGGELLLPNNQILRYGVAGIGSLPIQDGRYLLFLKHFPPKPDFTIISAYEIQNGKIFPLEKIPDRIDFFEMDEPAFINIIKKKSNLN